MSFRHLLTAAKGTCTGILQNSISAIAIAFGSE